jgi:L-amino acid N-acyltransferase YncA
MIEVKELSLSEWEPLSEDAHLVCFGTIRPAYRDRFDFALLATDQNQLLAYVTCRETDHDTLYWQYGGAFPSAQGSALSFRSYAKLVEHCDKAGYKQITTLIENENTVMLKMAMKVGFRIIGMRARNGKVFLEHSRIAAHAQA